MKIEKVVFVQVSKDEVLFAVNLVVEGSVDSGIDGAIYFKHKQILIQLFFVHHYYFLVLDYEEVTT